MGKDTGVSGQDKKAIEEITEGLDLPDFDLAEVPLSREFLIELFAVQALEYMKSLALAPYNIAANRAVHNSDEVTKIVIGESIAREALRRIKKDYPEAISLSAELAVYEARRGRESRNMKPVEQREK